MDRATKWAVGVGVAGILAGLYPSTTRALLEARAFHCAVLTLFAFEFAYRKRQKLWSFAEHIGPPVKNGALALGAVAVASCVLGSFGLGMYAVGASMWRSLSEVHVALPVAAVIPPRPNSPKLEFSGYTSCPAPLQTLGMDLAEAARSKNNCSRTMASLHAAAVAQLACQQDITAEDLDHSATIEISVLESGEPSIEMTGSLGRPALDQCVTDAFSKHVRLQWPPDDAPETPNLPRIAYLVRAATFRHRPPSAQRESVLVGVRTCVPTFGGVLNPTCKDPQFSLGWVK